MDSVEESGFPYSLPPSGATAGAAAAPSIGAAAATGAAAAAPAVPLPPSSQEGEGQAGPTPAKPAVAAHFEALLQNVPLSASLTASASGA